MAYVGVAGIMLCSIALASIPLAVGIVAGYLLSFYFRSCSQFSDLDPAFKLNRGILGIMYWVGLCINRNGPLLEGLAYCSD